MHAILQSFLLVFVSEIGDKTQLIALLLATKFKRPWAIMAGILIATLLNHGLASYLGGWGANLFAPQTLRWILSGLFVGFGLWILIPDKEEEISDKKNFGAFFTTLVVFFLAEMGDKTQLATVALGAKFNSIILVTAGTTLGMLAADGLVVFLGDNIVKKIPLQIIRYIACATFIIFALLIGLENFI